MTHFLMVPGYGGSGAQHWQTHWERQLGPCASRIRPASFDEPHEADWFASIENAMTDDTVIVAHSMGVLAVLSWLTARPARDPRVRGAFLVAPPDRFGRAYPIPAEQFGIEASALFTPLLMLSSTDDPYCSPESANQLAREWGAAHLVLGKLGHINSASGLGQWEAGLQLLTTFAAGLTLRWESAPTP